MSSATFYAWKAKYGGMDVSEAKRLRALEDETARLKRLYADAMLDSEPCRAIGPSDNGERAEGTRGKKR
jgi:putative transposase